MKGSGVFGKIKYESGVHRVQRMPETDTTVSIDYKMDNDFHTI